MKLGPITKLDKRNLSTFKKFDDDFMWVCCDVTLPFLIYDQFGAEQSGCRIQESMVCKTYIVINSNLSSYKN